MVIYLAITPNAELLKNTKAFKSFDEYKKSDIYENRMEKVNGFIFVEL